ncbi:MAG: DUF551 domain-containing protein, partial [Pseudomonadota bacterium]
PEADGAKAMTWQPIETAPKEGRILVYGGTWEGELGGKEPARVALVYAESLCVADTCYYDAWIVDPTHWMPLPEPPETKP